MPLLLVDERDLFKPFAIFSLRQGMNIVHEIYLRGAALGEDYGHDDGEIRPE